MKNLALSKTYYYEILKPWIEKNYPLLSDKFAGGLFECDDNELSYEDELGWKSFYYIWLTKEDYAAYAGKLTYQLQGEQLIPEAANASIVVTTVDTFVKLWFGIEKEQVQSTSLQKEWLTLSEQKLYAFSHGVIFEDPMGEITRIQCQLHYYPEDIRRKLLMLYWRKVNEISKVYQCHCSGNRIGEKLALNRVMETMLHLTYLYKKNYDPGELAWDQRDIKEVRKDMEAWMIRCYNSAFIDEIMMCFQVMVSILIKQDEDQGIGAAAIFLNVEKVLANCIMEKYNEKK